MTSSATDTTTVTAPPPPRKQKRKRTQDETEEEEDSNADGPPGRTKPRKTRKTAREVLKEKEAQFEENQTMDRDSLEAQQEAFEEEGHGEPSLAEITLLLETDPENEVYQAIARRYIEDLYVDNGGLPLNADNPIPRDLSKCSSKELSNIIKNMKISIVRSNKDDIVNKGTNLIANLTQIFGKLFGIPIGKSIAENITSDKLLRESFVEVFLGSTAAIHPLIAFGVSALSHTSNILLKFLDAPPTEPVGDKTAEGSGTGTEGSSRAPIASSTHHKN